MSFNGASNIFGKEKSKGALEGIIGSVYQTAFGEDIYPSNQEKAANLLYFIVKDHPFIDGCKRIAASIFLYFLNKNNLLFKGEEKIISDSTLVAITLLLAESKPEEKEVLLIIFYFLLYFLSSLIPSKSHFQFGLKYIQYHLALLFHLLFLLIH